MNADEIQRIRMELWKDTVVALVPVCGTQTTHPVNVAHKMLAEFDKKFGLDKHPSL